MKRNRTANKPHGRLVGPADQMDTEDALNVIVSKIRGGSPNRLDNNELISQVEELRESLKESKKEIQRYRKESKASRRKIDDLEKRISILESLYARSFYRDVPELLKQGSKDEADSTASFFQCARRDNQESDRDSTLGSPPSPPSLSLIDKLKLT